MKIYLLKRKRQLSKENHEKGKSIKISFYFMYHFGPGQKREYEWLDLFLYDKPKNQIQKDHNKITWQLAETIKAKKMVDDQTTAHGFISKVKSAFVSLHILKHWWIRRNQLAIMATGCQPTAIWLILRRED